MYLPVQDIRLMLKHSAVNVLYQYWNQRILRNELDKILSRDAARSFYKWIAQNCVEVFDNEDNYTY